MQFKYTSFTQSTSSGNSADNLIKETDDITSYTNFIISTIDEFLIVLNNINKYSTPSLQTGLEFLDSIQVIIPLITEDSFVAGGCFKDFLLKKQPKDIDVYFTDEVFDKMYSKFEKSSKHKQQYQTDKSSGYESIIPGEVPWVADLIKYRRGSPHKVISSFDFTITQFALFKGIESLMVIYHPDFLDDLVNKQLKLDFGVNMASRNANQIFDRTMRYISYGFKMTYNLKTDLFHLIRNSSDEARGINTKS